MTPRAVRGLLLGLALLAMLPPACIGLARVTHSPVPRLHLVQDMDDQPSYRPQQANPAFADGRAMRPPVPDTVAQGPLEPDMARARGVVGTEYARTLPVALTPELLARGRERYGIYCAPCHGLAGYGDGMVARRAELRQQGAWVPPASFHDEPAASRPPGHLFNTITHGIRNMPSYGEVIPGDDRWAIVAGVKALQRSQHASLDDVPAEHRAELSR